MKITITEYFLVRNILSNCIFFDKYELSAGECPENLIEETELRIKVFEKFIEKLDKEVIDEVELRIKVLEKINEKLDKEVSNNERTNNNNY